MSSTRLSIRWVPSSGRSAESEAVSVALSEAVELARDLPDERAVRFEFIQPHGTLFLELHNVPIASSDGAPDSPT